MGMFKKKVRISNLFDDSKYFEAFGEHYKDQNIKISFKEFIKNMQLAALIKS